MLTARRWRVAVGVPVITLVAITSACAATVRAGQPTGPGQDTLDCRAQWKALDDSLQGRDQQPDPSDLADRWNSVIATVQYYAAAATAKDCLSTLDQQKQTIGRIEEMSALLRPYDMSFRMAALAPTATDYLVAALPTPRKIAGKRVRPPSKQLVKHALRTLQDQATVSAADMKDGWDEANSADLTSTASVQRVLRDMKFLSGDSASFQACLAALAVLRRVAQFAVS